MRHRLSIRLFLAAVVAVGVSQAAQAHFLWLVTKSAEPSAAALHLYFSESAEPDDPALLERLGKVEAWRIAAGQHAVRLPLAAGEESLTTALSARDEPAVYLVNHTYGVLTRGDAVFLLQYTAKTGPSIDSPVWKADCSDRTDLDLVPELKDGHVSVRVLWKGKPAEGIDVVAMGPALEHEELKTDSAGRVALKKSKDGLYSFRAKHTEERAGTLKDQAYPAVRHYATLTVPVGAVTAPVAKTLAYPAIPTPVTSFGAAMVGDQLYIYGGHTGSAHAYSNLEQGNTLQRLDLSKPGDWETLVEGPRLQGLAMVAHGGKLYRLGGFTAKNAEGEAHDLWSQSDVACFDPETKQWRDLPPLPEARSSFDAAVLGDTIYVIGGWAIAGEGNNTWHKTAWSLDLSAEKLEWKALPEPPFQRRALSVAAFNGKLYAIGGMQSEGGPTTRVDVFDPASGQWSQGPNLIGEKPIAGFGSSAFAVGGRLYVSTIEGNLERLSADGSAWEQVEKLDRARFFHRMLPFGANQLVFVGGASMQEGKFEQVDVVDVP